MSPKFDLAKALRTSGLIALTYALLFWGWVLLPQFTLSAEIGVITLDPQCRLATDVETCAASYALNSGSEDMGGAAWAEIPIDYYFHSFVKEGKPLPYWNPYTGSGYPVALDGHNFRGSPTQWFKRLYPGSFSRDIIIFLRVLGWTWGVLLALSLLDAIPLTLWLMGFLAVLAPHITHRIDHVFLDVDLLAPWFTVIVLCFLRWAIDFKVGLALSGILGVLVGLLGFLEAQFIFCLAVAVVAALSAPATKGRSLFFGGALALGVLATFPNWFPQIQNIPNFITSRSTNACIARDDGIPWNTSWYLLTRLHVGETVLGTLTGWLVIFFAAPKAKYKFPVLALLVFGQFIVYGAPYFCSLPGVSGVRFPRHISASFEFYFLLCLGLGIQWLASQMGPVKWWAILFLGTIDAMLIRHALWHNHALYLTIASVLFLVVWTQRRHLAKNTKTVALMLVAFLITGRALALPSVFFTSVLRRQFPQEVAAVPNDISPTVPLGAIAEISQKEDRRHFSPDGLIFPNWSSAFKILDVRLLPALIPNGYYELNGADGLGSVWQGDIGHRLRPDRFTVTKPNEMFSGDFEKLLALNRVSLFTYMSDEPIEQVLGWNGGPYDQRNCEVLKTSARHIAYRCPSIGPVGYFPSDVKILHKKEVIPFFKATPVERLKDLLVLDPASISESSAVQPAAGKVLSFTRDGDSLNYQLSVHRPGYFVIADTFFPGWTATVNGKAQVILPANLVFKAVRVPVGTVDLKLHFELK